MSQRILSILLMSTLLGGCGGNPFPSNGLESDGGSDGGGTIGGGGKPPPPPPPPPLDQSSVTQDVRGATFKGGVLRIDMAGVSSSGQYGTFKRRPSMDIAGQGTAPKYLAYVYQETALTPSYLAYVATNARGSIWATASSSGGQFNEHNRGGQFYRLTAYTRPNVTANPSDPAIPDTIEKGTFSYAGSYAAVFVPGPAAVGNTRPPGLKPGEPWSVAGTIQINAQFTSAAGKPEVIEGGVTNRTLRDRDGNQITSVDFGSGSGTTTVDTTTLPDIVLRETTIDSTGLFLGKVEFNGAPNSAIGAYGGAFAGAGASDVAGILWLNPLSGQSGVWEYGVFNLPRCDLAGRAPLCVPR